MDSKLAEIQGEVSRERRNTASNVQSIAYLVATTLVCPLTVLGTSLQLTSRPAHSYQSAPQTHALSLLQLSKSHEVVVQEKAFNALQLASGMVGENKPFKAAYYKNYRECFLALSGQGYLGFYKGNGVDVLFQIGRLSMKIPLMDFLGFSYQYPGITKFTCDMIISIGVDIVMQPLHNIQSRYILQNRLKEFRTYKSLYSTALKLRWRELYQGYTAIMPQCVAMNISLFAFTQGLNYATAPIAFGFYCLSYACMTAQRRIEVQSRDHTMLPRQFLNFRYAMSKMYHEEGIAHGLFRGITCNTLALAGRLTLTTPIAMAITQFVSYYKFKSKGWDLV